ncbi:MAG: hypothetical protein MUF58_24190 [Arcicella sp.]|nr:hypothetical protein [Arcicella sp.]
MQKNIYRKAFYPLLKNLTNFTFRSNMMFLFLQIQIQSSSSLICSQELAGFA